jgi:hypothetical protein
VRASLARGLVRWASRWWDASYAAYCRRDQGEVPSWWDKPWTYGAKHVSRLAIPLAVRLDRDAAVDTMANSGWWG